MRAQFRTKEDYVSYLIGTSSFAAGEQPVRDINLKFVHISVYRVGKRQT